MSISSGCVYNSSQPITPYYALTFQGYGFYIGGVVSTVATPIFLYFGVRVPAMEHPKPGVNYRWLAAEVLVLGAMIPPAGWIAGKALGTFVDYASYYAQTFYCVDVAKNNK